MSGRLALRPVSPAAVQVYAAMRRRREQMSRRRRPPVVAVPEVPVTEANPMNEKTVDTFHSVAADAEKRDPSDKLAKKLREMAQRADGKTHEPRPPQPTAPLPTGAPTGIERSLPVGDRDADQTWEPGCNG